LLVVACILVPALLAYSFALGSEMRVTAVVLGILALTVVLTRPFWGLLLFCALLYFRPEETFPQLAGTRLTLCISVAAAVGLWLQMALNRESAVRTPLNVMIIGFGLAVVASTGMLGNTVEAATDAGRLVLLVLLIVNMVRTPERYQALITTVLLCTGYLALYSIYLYLTGHGLQHGDVQRAQASGIFGDPNDLAATITAGLALCLPRVTQSRGLPRILYSTLGLICVWAILTTNSRGGMVAMLAVIGAFSLVYVKNKGLAILLSVVIGGLFLVLGPSRMTTFDSTEASANERFWYWSTGIDTLIQHPVLGVGYSQFVEVNHGMMAHNSYVQCFAELGMVGYFFWIGCLYFGYRRRPRSADAPPLPPEFARDLLAARLALAGFLVAAFFITRTFVPVLYMLIALPVSAQVASEQPGTVPTEKAGAWFADWGRILMVALGSILFIKLFAEHFR
ncbi:MAG: O-antigen polymerase, partial [Armatimonadetes bacterium]|nr:O-antigen polymerase [Armatimonadota bacterium]